MSRTVLKLARAQSPNMARIRHAVRLFRNDLAPRSVRRHNARSWLRAIEMLGPKWVYAETQRLQKVGA